MKKIILLLALSLFVKINAQDVKKINISSRVNKATVFLNSAQVTRTKNVSLTKGIQIVKFTSLSPFVDKKSIQVKAKNIEIQSINFQKNYKKLTEKSDNQKALEKELNEFDNQIDKEKINLNIVNEEISFLKNNRSLKGNETLTGAVLKEAVLFYNSKITELFTKQFKIETKLKSLDQRKNKVIKQLNDLSSVREFPTGEILIKIASNSIKTTKFELTYNVGNVSWYPTYDIKAKDINSPLSIIYKANVKQNSKVDWNNVKLRFSSANPSNATKASELKPYFLNYGTKPPTYNNSSGEVTGTVYDYDGTTLPSVTVIVKGTSIGTVTDFDGIFSIKVPDNADELVFSYLGFKTLEKNIQPNMGNIYLEVEEEYLEEVVVVGYGTKKGRPRKGNTANILRGKTPGISTSKSIKRKIKEENTEPDYALPTEQIINQTSVSFEIVKPYTLKSGNKEYTVAMKTYTSKADYSYYSVPKIEQNVFLIASIEEWEKLNLLEGEANIYFEDTFVGTSLIDTRFTDKKLDISLGIDKNVTITRKKLKDFTTRQFIGNKKEENRIYELIVKNNKQQAIDISILDQIPIAKREEITVTLDESSSGKLDEKTGEILWKHKLKPNTSKTMNLKYSVRYPKGREIYID
jgi:hypothetical protein